MSSPASPDREFMVFVCDSLMRGESQHELLAEARLVGEVRTKPAFHLVDLGASGALLTGGTSAVVGELYALGRVTLAALDVHKGHPILHQRCPLELEDGREADAYFISLDQSRGLRRVRTGDWKNRRVLPGSSRVHDGGALVRWARKRFDGDR